MQGKIQDFPWGEGGVCIMTQTLISFLFFNARYMYPPNELEVWGPSPFMHASLT